jgi:hypothetical protein
MLLSRPYVYDTRDLCILCQVGGCSREQWLLRLRLYRLRNEIFLCISCRMENEQRYQRQVRKTVAEKKVTVHQRMGRYPETPRHPWSAPTSCLDCGMSWAQLRETYPHHDYLDTYSYDSWASDQAPEGMAYPRLSLLICTTSSLLTFYPFSP